MPETFTLNGLMEKVRSYSPDKDFEALKKAYHFSSEAHCSQTRSEGSPYIKHPLAVAYILADMRMDTPSISAGLLHDTVEDTGVSAKDVKEIFGDEIAFLVESLTKLSRIEFKTKEEAQAENFRKMLLAMSEDIRVIFIKFADRLHNMRTLQYLPENKRQRIATETLEIYAPLANRLGMGWLRIEFEDLSFKFLMPDLYEELVLKVAKRKEEQEGYLNEVSRTVEKKLKEAGLYGKVSGRVKHSYGIYQKMQRQRVTFDEIHDVLGLRIITDTKANCYTIMGLIHSLWTPIPGRFKDYIAIPKANGYQSLHTTLFGPFGTPIEVQIRTHEMHKIAEAGVASHWLYKDADTSLSDLQKKTHQWLQSLLELQSQSGDSAEFLEHLKVDLFPDEVYVFTPRGKILSLPRGATAVAFAYAVHTDIGNRCVAVKINQELMPLRTELKNGDRVEIITAAHARPNPMWLNFVATGKARSRIRHFLKTMHFQESARLGERLLNQALTALGVAAADVQDAHWEKFMRDAGVKSRQEVLADIGLGKRLSAVVANQRGVLAKVAAEIAEAGSNIQNVAVDPEDGSQYTNMFFTLQVSNRLHLARILRALRRIPEVVRLARVKG